MPVEAIAEQIGRGARTLQHRTTWGDDVPLPTEEHDKRKTEVDGILTELRGVSKGEGKKYYPIRFLRDGIDAYVSCFDNGAIYYASLAVEVALIIRLSEKGILHQWRNEEKTRVRQGKKRREASYPNLSTLIKWAARTGLLNRRVIRLAHNVRKARNSYMHYYNVMWHQVDVDCRTRKNIVEMLPKVKEEIQRFAQPEERDAMLKIINSMTASLLEDKTISDRGIPIGDIRPNREAVEFIDKREKSFVKQLSNLEDKSDWDQFARYIINGIEWRDALDCVQWSADILGHLRFLSEDDRFEKTS